MDAIKKLIVENQNQFDIQRYRLPQSRSTLTAIFDIPGLKKINNYPDLLNPTRKIYIILDSSPNMSEYLRQFD